MEVTVAGGTLTLDESLVDVRPATLWAQLREYAAGDRRRFAVEVSVPDTFTGAVMRAMTAIPYGETRTYGDLAARVDSSPVAVGGACGRNSLPVVVPCHRVVGAESLGGFSAAGGVDQKRALLELEGGLPARATLPDLA